MNKKRFYSYLLLSAFITVVFGFIVFFSLSLNGDRFTQEFYSQNHQNIEAGNSFALIPQLNSLLRQDVIACIDAQANGQVFFTSKETCTKSLLTRNLTVSGKGSNTVIRFTYTLSKVFYAYLTLAFLFTTISANLLLRMVFKIEDLERNSLARINEMARRVAHDIRSPLSALNLLASALKNTNEEQAELIKGAVHNINSIANDLLIQSKEQKTSIKATSQEEQSCKVNQTLQAIVKEKTLEYEDRSIPVNITIKKSQVSDSLSIALSKIELSRIVSNLLNNSAEAARENTSIDIDVTEKEKSILVTITDFGRGIPPEILDLLMKVPVSFGKDQSSSGNGIGLYSANQVLTKIGGSIAIQSQLGVGTKITLTIPTLG